MSVELKTVDSKTYFGTQKQLTLMEIGAFAGEAMEPLCAEASKLGLEIVGPPEFIYLNITGEPNVPFQLVIALPIQKKSITVSDSKYFMMETGEYHCASTLYNGAIDGIGDAWCSFVGNLLEQGYNIANQCREVYLKWEDCSSDKNVVELQTGINFKTL